VRALQRCERQYPLAPRALICATVRIFDFFGVLVLPRGQSLLLTPRKHKHRHCQLPRPRQSRGSLKTTFSQT
jgi:hypothetical protein